jgi:hypothetical protein
MKDDNWELINGPVAHEIEIINYGNQVNLIEAFLKFAIHHQGTGPDGCPLPFNTVALRELHRTGTFLLLAKPGEWRDGPVNVVDRNGNVIHAPPSASEVPALMDQFDKELKANWRNPPLEVAAFALWRLNWIHPFKNGNGRTARAFAYACLCQRYGFLLPGEPTIIDQIIMTRGDGRFEAALRQADLSLEATGAADLSAMVAFLTELLTVQLSSIQ